MKVPSGEGAARRARILTRVSDDKLRSIPQQVADCAAYAAGIPGLAVDGIYNVGEHSGFAMSESEVYRTLLADARDGGFHVLVIRDSSRLGRDYWEKFGTLRDLRAAGVELHVVEDGGRFDYEDRLSKVKSWASSWADEEKKREEIRKAVRATEALRAQGLPTVTPPFGYESVRDARLGRRVWRPTRDAAKVRDLFRLALERPGDPVAALARAAGVERRLASRILANPAYTGGFAWKGEFVACDAAIIPPLVDEETFRKVQARRAGP